ncbi:MAG: tetratricopeptide repeat protein [Pseudomonadota bacterium]
MRVQVNRAMRYLTIVLSLGLALVGCSSSEERQARYFTRAQALMEEGDYAKAKLEVRNVLQINESHVQARYLWALLQEREQNYRQMFANLQLAVDLDPTYVEARIKFGQLLYRAQLYDEAAEEALAVLELEPDNADALTLRGSVHYRQSDNAKAVDLANRALQSAPGHVGATSIITEVYKQDDPERALAVIGEGLGVSANSAALRLMEINVFEAQGSDEQVVDAYRSLIADFPENLLYHYRLVKFLEERQRLSEAEAVLREIVKTKPDDTQLKLWLAEFLANQRDLHLAESTVREFIAREPRIYELRFALGKIYESLSLVDAANGVYDEIVALDGEGADGVAARNRKLAILMSDFQVDDARALIAEITEIEPDNSSALIASARLDVGESNYETAVTRLRTVTKNEPTNASAWEAMARVNTLRGATDLAIDNYKTALALQPSNLRALTFLYRLLSDSGDTEAAHKHLRDAVERMPGNAALQRMRGMIALQTNDSEELEIVQRWFNDQGLQAEGMLLSARALMKQGDFDEGEAELLRAWDAAAHGWSYSNAVASFYISGGRIADGVSAFQERMAGAPDNPDLQNGYAMLLHASRDSESAIQVLLTTLQSNPNYPSFELLAEITSHAALEEIAIQAAGVLEPRFHQNPQFLQRYAQLLAKTGDLDSAVHTYKRLMMLNPDSTVAANNLAMLLISPEVADRDARQALSLASRFSSSRSPALLDTFGRALLANDRPREALRVFERVQEFGGSEALDAEVFQVAQARARAVADG